MNIWLTRHGQTNLNAAHIMQGHTNEPLNDTGRAQAHQARALIGDMAFDAVYSSPLDRAIETGTIIGNVPRSSILIDERIIEANFGKYEGRHYEQMGLAMSLYWALPEVFPAPRTVETIASMIARTRSFLQDLEKKDYENVLVSCHGGILRPMCGYLQDKRNGIVWRPKPKNCEIRVYESIGGKHRFLRQYKLPEAK